MIHKSVLREVVVETLSNHTDTSSIDLEEELLDNLSTIFDVVDDEDDEIERSDD